MRCHSCRAELPQEALRPALSVFWEPIPGVSECRDAEACFARVLGRPALT